MHFSKSQATDFTMNLIIRIKSFAANIFTVSGTIRAPRKPRKQYIIVILKLGKYSYIPKGSLVSNPHWIVHIQVFS